MASAWELLKGMGRSALLLKYAINLLSGVVGAVWLLAEGQGHLVAIGVMVLVFGKYLIAILGLPAFLIFGMPAARAEATGDHRQYRKLARLNNGSMTFLAWIWCTALVALMLEGTDGTPARSPLLIWAYAVSMGPWAAIAQQSLASGANDLGSGAFMLSIVDIGMILAVILDIVLGVHTLYLLPLVAVAAFVLSERAVLEEEKSQAAPFSF